MAPKLLYELKTVAKIGYKYRNRCIPDTMVREWQRSGQWCGNHRVPGGKLAPAQFRGCGKFAPTYIEAETNRLGRLKSYAPALHTFNLPHPPVPHPPSVEKSPVLNGHAHLNGRFGKIALFSPVFCDCVDIKRQFTPVSSLSQ